MKFVIIAFIAVIGIVTLSGCYSQIDITAPNGTTARYISTKSVEGLEVQIEKSPEGGYNIRWVSSKAGADANVISAAVTAAIQAVR